MMGTSQRVRVTDVHDDRITIETTDGATFTWPRKNAAGELLPVAVNDELVLTLTSSDNLLNDLLTKHD